MESYVHNGCAQWEFIMCSTGVLNGKVFWMLLGILLCAQQDIIGGLNGKVFWMLLGKLMVCSMWNDIVLNWTLLGCSTGSYVLNRKL